MVSYVNPAKKAPGVQTGHTLGVICIYRTFKNLFLCNHEAHNIVFYETMRLTAYEDPAKKFCHWVRITSVLRFIKHIFITTLQSIPPLLKHIFVTFLPSREKQISNLYSSDVSLGNRGFRPSRTGIIFNRKFPSFKTLTHLKTVRIEMV